MVQVNLINRGVYPHVNKKKSSMVDGDWLKLLQLPKKVLLFARLILSGSIDVFVL